MHPTADKTHSDQKLHETLTWKPLRLLTFYRLILVGLLLVLYLGIPGGSTFGSYDPALYVITCTLYLGFSLLAGFNARLHRPAYELQVTLQVLVDIAAITLLMHASGGLASGLGILLIITVAAGSLLMPGRISFLFAAVTAIVLIAEQTYSTAVLGLPRPGGFTEVGILGAAFFATASLTYFLARRIHASEALARRRGIDIANLSRLNAHIVQRLQAGIVVTDQQHHIRLINQTAIKLLGVPSDCAGQALEQVAPALFEKLIAWRKSPDMEPALLESEATSAPILPQFTLIGTADGLGALIFLEDTAAMARQAQQMKLASLGRLTASIAHEIRNPLGAISHATQLLNESDALGSEDQRLTTIIRDHAMRVNTVVENVLQLSRPGTAMPKNIPLRQWLGKFSEEFVHSGNCTPEQISVSVEPADLEIYMDPGQLHQVVWNLCLNAMLHGRCGDEPAMLRLEGSHVDASQAPHLDIIDRGTGIDPSMAETIFEPFFTTRSSGTGLGLYIARGLCESNQARLNYKARPEGGSRFRITFPDSAGLAIQALA